MKLGLQFGHGMMAHSQELLQQWGGGTIVLSPRDLDKKQLSNCSKSYQDIGGRVLIDPQCYTRNINLPKLMNHLHINQFLSSPTINFTALNNGINRVIKSLRDECLDHCNLSEAILPSLIGGYRNSQFRTVIESTIAEANKELSDFHLIQTVALDAEYVRHEEEMEALLEWLTTLEIDEFYIVAEPPNGYMLNDPIWNGNLMTFCAGLKLSKKKVILGYANHQHLPLACTGIDTMLSGNYLNVRSFSEEKFQKPDSQKNKSTWYYCPQTLSEYKIVYLDMAHKNSVLSEMAPSEMNSYALPLFSGTQPSLIDWKEGVAHKHYLTELKKQCDLFSTGDYTIRKNFAEEYLSNAKKGRVALERNGVRAETRSTEEAVEAMLSGITELNRNRGAQLSRNWPN